MTWITDIEQHVKSKYDVDIRVTENFKTRYKKYHHRASFIFRYDLSEKNYISPFLNRDYQSSWELSSQLVSKLGESIKIRHEWFETFVYFNDLDEFMSAIPVDKRAKLYTLELMSEAAINAIENFEHDYRVDLVVKKNLPYGRYRYKNYVVSDSRTRVAIGETILTQLYEALTVYDGIKVSNSFIRTHKHKWIDSNTFFYSESLDWLPMISLMDPRYIKRIEQFKTTKELNNETTTKNSA